MEYLLIAISFFLLGVILTPLLLFLRARRDDAWDDSNIANMYIVIFHLAAHPSDFGKMVYKGTDINPFWFISKDLFADIIKNRS